MTKPAATVTPNTWEFLRDAMIAPTGFREYDARWKYPEEINLPGMTALGLGLGTQMQTRGIDPVIAVGNDYRDYSVAIKNALAIGLIQAGIQVKDMARPCRPWRISASSIWMCLPWPWSPPATTRTGGPASRWGLNAR